MDFTLATNSKFVKGRHHDIHREFLHANMSVGTLLKVATTAFHVGLQGFDLRTDGLDPNQKQEVRSLIKRMGEGKVIIFSTHILEEVEAACTRAIIIDQGRVVADGTPDELKARASGAGAVTVRITGMAASGIRSELAGLPGAKEVLGDDSGDDGFSGKVLPTKSGDSLSQEIFNLCKDKQLVLEELHVEQGRLDDVFREITVADTTLNK